MYGGARGQAPQKILEKLKYITRRTTMVGLIWSIRYAPRRDIWEEQAKFMKYCETTKSLNATQLLTVRDISLSTLNFLIWERYLVMCPMICAAKIFNARKLVCFLGGIKFRIWQNDKTALSSCQSSLRECETSSLTYLHTVVCK